MNLHACKTHGTLKVLCPGNHWRCKLCQAEADARSSAKKRQSPCFKCGSGRAVYRRCDGKIYMVCHFCKAERRRHKLDSHATEGLTEGYWEQQARLERADAERIRLEIAAVRLEAIRAAGMRLHDHREATRREWERKAREQRQGARV